MQHAERNYIVFFAIYLKVGRVVAFVAIKDHETIATICSLNCTPVKVLKPLKAHLVHSRLPQ